MMRIHELSSKECSFAVLDAPTGSGKDARLELLYQFEALLPQSVDEVQVVFTKPMDGKVIACACDKETVQGFRSKAEMLIPDSVPDWLEVEVSDTQRQQLNLLTGSMRPISSLNRDRATAKLVCFASIVALLVVFVGAHRRINQIETQQASVNEQIASVYDSVLPRASGPNTQPNAIRFATLLNQARATRTGAVQLAQQDLVKDLVSILGQWPTEIDIQVRSLILNLDTVRVELSVQDSKAATQVIDRLGQLTDWAIETRSMTPRSDQVDLSMTFSRSANEEQSS